MRNLFSFCMLFCATAIVGCGGGGSHGGPSGNPTITSVTPTCSPTSVAEGGTSSCTATVQGTGSYSSSVTWSASAGTITSAGAFTAPAIAGSVTVTATSTEDPTKSGTATITVTTPVQVVISPTSVSVPSGWTEQFVATVTGSSNTAVTWSASAGAISTSGLLSLAGVAADTDVTVTATSQADPTKSASAIVTVTQRVITISTLANRQVIASINMGPGSAIGIVIDISGAEVGDIATYTENGKSGSLTLTSDVISAGSIELTLQGIASLMPNWGELTVASADGTIQSNQLWFAITNDQNVLAMSTDGTTVYGVSGQPFQIQQYASTDGTDNGPLATGSATGQQVYSLAVDDQTGYVIDNTAKQFVDSNNGSMTNNNVLLMAVAARGGYGYMTEPAAGEIEQFNISQMSITSSVPAGNEPWTMDAATVNNADGILVYSKEDTTLWLFNNQLATVTSLVLTGITKSSDVQTATVGVGGAWMVQLFGSGPAANFGAFLSVYDQSLVFWSVDGTNTLHLENQETLTGNPFLIAKDETHGAIIVAFLNLTNGMITMQSINMQTYQATNLTSPSTLPIGFMAGGILVSPDGSKIYVVGTLNGQQAFYVLQNQ